MNGILHLASLLAIEQFTLRAQSAFFGPQSFDVLNASGVVVDEEIQIITKYDDITVYSPKLSTLDCSVEDYVQCLVDRRKNAPKIPNAEELKDIVEDLLEKEDFMIFSKGNGWYKVENNASHTVGSYQVRPENDMCDGIDAQIEDSDGKLYESAKDFVEEMVVRSKAYYELTPDQQECMRKYGSKNWTTYTIQVNDLTEAQADAVHNAVKTLCDLLSAQGYDVCQNEKVMTNGEGDYIKE